MRELNRGKKALKWPARHARKRGHKRKFLYVKKQGFSMGFRKKVSKNPEKVLIYYCNFRDHALYYACCLFMG